MSSNIKFDDGDGDDSVSSSRRSSISTAAKKTLGTIFDFSETADPISPPPVYDLAGDRVHSRTLAALSFFLMLLIVSWRTCIPCYHVYDVVILPAIFHSPASLYGEAKPAKVFACMMVVLSSRRWYHFMKYP